VKYIHGKNFLQLTHAKDSDIKNLHWATLL